MRCSNRCAKPVRPSGSERNPTSTWTATPTTGVFGSGARSTRSPLERVGRWRSGTTPTLTALTDTLPGARVRRQHNELAQRQVEVRHRPAGARGVVDVDPGLGQPEQLVAVEQAGRGVPEHAGTGVGVDERRRRLLVLCADRRG